MSAEGLRRESKRLLFSHARSKPLRLGFLKQAYNKRLQGTESQNVRFVNSQTRKRYI